MIMHNSRDVFALLGYLKKGTGYHKYEILNIKSETISKFELPKFKTSVLRQWI